MSNLAKHREFMTTWHRSPRPELVAWSDRGELSGSVTTSHRVPMFRGFDLLAMPNQSLILLENEDQRIGVESVCGASESFQRHVDFDTVYFQFAGRTTLETEYGEYEMGPGDVMLVPEGIAHRSTGTADSLRWFAWVLEPFTEFMNEGDQISHTEFEVTRHAGPSWQISAGRERPKKEGRVKERMTCWKDRPEDFTVGERDYEYLVGASSSHMKEKVSAIRKLRAFDMFTEIVGKHGGAKPIFRSPHLEIKTYNITGEQFAFHRALRSEEVRIQFRGEAIDLSEIENVMVAPGDVTVIPRGIAHSVMSEPLDSKAFLRFNFYSDIAWRYPNDLTRHHHDSTFEIKTTVLREAAWRAA